MIRIINSEEDLRRAAEIIRAAFFTIAEEGGITPANCPAFPAFITDIRVQELIAEGLQFYGLFDREALAGVVGLRKLDNRRFNMEKLAVLPAYRHRGFGRQLVDFCCDIARREGSNKLSLATGLEAKVLVAWYLAQGFVQTDVQKYPGLPFSICFLEKAL